MISPQQFMETLGNDPDIVKSLSGLELPDGVTILETRSFKKSLAFKLSNGQVVIMRVFVGDSWDKFTDHLSKMEEIVERYKKEE